MEMDLNSVQKLLLKVLKYIEKLSIVLLLTINQKDLTTTIVKIAQDILRIVLHSKTILIINYLTLLKNGPVIGVGVQ